MIQVYTYTFFFIFFYYGLSQDFEYSNWKFLTVSNQLLQKSQLRIPLQCHQLLHLPVFMMFSHLVMPTPSALFLSFLLSHFLYYFCQEAFSSSLHAPLGCHRYCTHDAELKFMWLCASLVYKNYPNPLYSPCANSELAIQDWWGRDWVVLGAVGQDISGWDRAERVWVVRAQQETLGDLEAWMLNSPQPWMMLQIKTALLKLMGALTNPVNK